MRDYVKDDKRNGKIDQLISLMQLTRDGDLISKSYRDDLVKSGHVCRFDGYNLITKKGFRLLRDAGYIKQ